MLGGSVSWLLFLLHNHERVDRIKGGLKRMVEKKHAINISFVMIVFFEGGNHGEWRIS